MKKIFISIVFLSMLLTRCEAIGQTTSDTHDSLNSQLFNSDIFDDPAAILRLLDEGASVDARDKDGSTLLIQEAEYEGVAATVKVLLEHGADVNAKDKDGNTPLIEAAQHSDPDVVALLLEHGANVNVDINGIPAPLWAAIGGDDQHDASTRIQNATVLLEHGADFQSCGEDGVTPLMQVAQDDDMVPVLKLLLAKGARIDARDSTGETALYYAGGAEESMATLLDHGANIDTRDNEGKTPLMHAAEYGHRKTIAFLLARGAKVNSKDKHGLTALGYAMRSTYIKPSQKTRMIKLLRAHGAH